jgi:2-haloacid dehalogenase
MTLQRLTDVRACVFDAYGTLFDLTAAARACADVLGPKAAPLAALWRDKQLQYTWLLATQGRYLDFAEVTGGALDFALESLAIEAPGLRDRLMKLYFALDAFPEARDALGLLKSAGLRLAILSNGTPAMLAAAVANARLDDVFEAVLSVDAVGVYKPHPKVYQMALDRLDLPASAIAFISSNGWDAYAASAFGMRVVWCNRAGQPPERLPGAPDRQVASLATLPDLVGAD